MYQVWLKSLQAFKSYVWCYVSFYQFKWVVHLYLNINGCMCVCMFQHNIHIGLLLGYRFACYPGSDW
jgi:hypothetical protein